MTDIVVPFNFQPANDDFGNDGTSYTVPAGFYAEVSVCASVSCTGFIDGPTNVTAGTGVTTANSNTHSGIYRLKEGDTISVTQTNTTATATAGSDFALQDAAQVTISINGNKVADVRAIATVSGQSAGGFGQVASVRGGVDVDFAVAEFNELS